SREIARLLGGEINLQSRLHEGSVFTVSVPRDKTLVSVIEGDTGGTQPLNPIEELIADIKEVSSYTTVEIPEEVDDDRNNIQHGDKLILIVEDDTNFAKALLKYTRQQKYKGIVLVRGDL